MLVEARPDYAGQMIDGLCKAVSVLHDNMRGETIADELRVDDVVVLKSGSVKMTIQKAFDGNEFECVWFDSKQEHKTAVFVAETLEKA